MRPAVSRSGRAKKKLRSIRKYSCSGPAVDATNAPSVLPNSFRIALGLLVERLHRTQQRRLLVERFAGPGDERRRNAERRAVGVFQDVGRAGDVPDRVAAGFERGADAAGREARAVGLALDQLLAGELGHRAAVAVGREEAVVLFGGEAGEREEDVGVVRRALFDRPVLHRRGDDVGDRRIELLARLRSSCISDLKTGFGSRFFITDLLKTLQPKSSDVGVSMKLSGSEIGL